MTKSASGDRRTENIRILAMIISERELSDIQRQVFVTHLVERTDDAAFKQRPKTFNRIGVNGTDYILLNFVVCGLARIFFQAPIDLMLVGRQQADLVGNCLAYESFDIALVDVIENASDDVALALDCADDGCLARTSTAALAVVPLVPVAIVILAADPSLIHFDYAAKLLLRLNHRSADFVGHIQRGFVGAKAHLALDLQRTNPLFTRSHQVNDLEPLAERFVRVFEDRARKMRKTITLVGRALVALPLERHGADREHLHGPTARANNTLRPASLNQIRLAGVLIREHRLKLAFGHLVNRLWSLGRHFGSSDYDATIVRFSVPVKRQTIASQEAWPGAAPNGRKPETARAVVERRQASASRWTRAARKRGGWTYALVGVPLPFVCCGDGRKEAANGEIANGE